MHMNADTAELHRLLSNLIRLGTIAEVDHVAALARVQIGQLLTEWRPWSTQRAGNARTWWAPSIGEQVMFFSPGGDMASGIIMSSVYSTAHPAPSENPAFDTAIYPDGAVIQYDHESHALTAILPDDSSAKVKADEIIADAPQTTCTGDLHVNGTITADVDVIANGISLVNHVHSGVVPGPANTGSPQ